jgi:hypothetical protein
LVERDEEIKHIICGDCAFNNLSPTEQSVYMLNIPLPSFFTSINDELNVNYPIICAVPKSASRRKTIILQRCVQDKNVIFVPVFYEC